MGKKARRAAADTAVVSISPAVEEVLESGSLKSDIDATFGGKKRKKPSQALVKENERSDVVKLDANGELVTPKKAKSSETTSTKIAPSAAKETEDGFTINIVEGDEALLDVGKKGKKKKKKTDKWGKKLEDVAAAAAATDHHEDHEEAGSNQGAQSQEEFYPNKVMVGGMPYYSTEDDMHDFFHECGTIAELDCMTFPDTGKFKGIAFITFKDVLVVEFGARPGAVDGYISEEQIPALNMAFFDATADCMAFPDDGNSQGIDFITFKTEQAARRALALDGADMGGRFLKIELCKIKPKEPAKKELYQEPPKKAEGCISAYIGNLSWDITEAEVRKFFEGCKIDAIRFAENKETGEFQGFGHIDFADDESLEAAMKLDQQEVLGRPLKIAYSVPRKTRMDNQTPSEQSKKKRGCYTCGEEDHMSYNCPKKPLV